MCQPDASCSLRLILSAVHQPDGHCQGGCGSLWCCSAFSWASCTGCLFRWLRRTRPATSQKPELHMQGASASFPPSIPASLLLLLFLGRAPLECHWPLLGSAAACFCQGLLVVTSLPWWARGEAESCLLVVSSGESWRQGGSRVLAQGVGSWI